MKLLFNKTMLGTVLTVMVVSVLMMLSVEAQEVSYACNDLSYHANDVGPEM